MQERTSLEDALTGIGKVERDLTDNVEMIELGEAEGDERDGGREGAPAASEADPDEDALPDADFLRDDERPEGSR